MGADHSSLQVQLVPQQNYICAIESRFCLPMTVQLRLREKLWSASGDDFKITDPATGVVYFQCQGRFFSLREKKTLYDSAGVPVLNMKDQLVSFTDTFKIYAGNDSTRQICKLKTELNFIKAKLSTVFSDAISGRQRHIVLKGNWREKVCLIYLGEPKQNGIPIARVYRPDTMRSILAGIDDYYLEIAPGVDIALMVIMCIALDEHQRDA